VNIVIASDHNGVELKEKIKSYLASIGVSCVDLGPYSEDNKVDYTDYAFQVGTIVQNKDVSRGILVCGTGVGMSIAANRLVGVRAALVHNIETAPKCREHNDSNVLCLGSWITDEEESLDIVSTWLTSEFGERRHVKRIEKLNPNKVKTVFTNGVFDILHTGHIEILKFAKNLGDRLIVAINSDQSVRKLKGDDRPINDENDRLTMIQSIRWVDEAFIFDSTDTVDAISNVNPDIVVKGGEWTKDEVRERDNIPEDIEVKICPLFKNKSTTNTLKKIVSWQKKS
jgi:ribose 5-phosphate isomerase B|tara:strand:- start:10105 stop:10956 length:852 start_codon:yes stop_codon:yes gene_type:complete